MNRPRVMKKKIRKQASIILQWIALAWMVLIIIMLDTLVAVSPETRASQRQKSSLQRWAQFPTGMFLFLRPLRWLISIFFTVFPFLTLWCKFINGMDSETAGVQRIIHHNQHPRNCESRKFFVWSQRNAGMGSDIHRTGEISPLMSWLSITSVKLQNIALHHNH